MSAAAAIQLPRANLRWTAASSPAEPDAPTESAHLAFSIGGQPYACSIARLEKLLRVADATIVPMATSERCVAGILSSRGGSVPIVRLDVLWGLPSSGEEVKPAQALLVFRDARDSFAILVDACLGVLKSLPGLSTQFALPAALTSGHGTVFEAIMPWREQLLVKVRLEHLLPAELRERLRTPDREGAS